ncbi:unnamed protein product [Caenorhabditis angaria]|uniref:RING-type domain-containing protein n=1 Tax=Caenorhabditis angaria TaxID=860376 RepID=A0A9P1I1M0_9PELO|nr:unnamed protein product [Caenorhabditis angaria]
MEAIRRRARHRANEIRANQLRNGESTSETNPLDDIVDAEAIAFGVEGMRSRAATMSAVAGAQVDQGIKKIKEISIIILETGLRLPGLILLELLWRYQDATFEEISDDMIKISPLSYLDMAKMLDFVHRRDFDQSAAFLMSYTVIFISLMFLTLPLNRLARMYSHALSLALFGFAYKLSTKYIDLEVESGESEIKLDGLVKLERHGFHFLSQMLLAVLQSMLLEMEGEYWRVVLPMFTLPIVARMCGWPAHRLITAHNFSCMLMLVFTCMYILCRAPNLMKSARISLSQIKAIFVIRGLAMGAVTVWRRLRIAELMTFTWITMFSMRLYVEVFEKGRQWSEAGRILLAGVAETTHTPISLLALAITVSYVCKWVADGAQMMIGGTRDHGHVLAHAGYTESFTLFVLCAQTGMLGMKTEQKAVLLGIVLFIVMSALLQSLYELLEPEIMNLSSSPLSTRSRHVRCLSLTVFLILFPICMVHVLLYVLPFDLWCVIILANTVLTTVHSIATLLKYFVSMVDAQSEEPWEGCDDLTFIIDCTTKIVELLISKCVLVFGCIQIVNIGLSFATIAIMLFHVIINIYKRIENLINLIKNRNAAQKNINRLRKATQKQLEEREDVCAICFIDMREEARITPCRHFFHGPCLRKWLAVKLVCPLCYSEMKEEDIVKSMKEQQASTQNPPRLPQEAPLAAAPQNHHQEQVERVNRRAINGEVFFDWDDMFNWSNLGIREMRGARNRDEQRLHGARDMWPLLVDNEAYESDSSTASEYTIQTDD